MTRAVLPLLLLAAAAGAEPVLRFALGEEDPAVWSRKSNTEVTAVTAPESRPGGALRATIDPAEFGFGWINRSFPEADYATAAGLHGYYRARAGGGLTVHVMLMQTDGQPSYFRADLGDLALSGGEWTEFYVDFAHMRHERGPRKSFSAAQLTTADRLQFLASAGGRQPVAFEIAELAVVAAEDAAPLAKRMAREKLRRELLPEEEIAGSVHPRLLLGDAELAALQADIARHPTLALARDRIVQLADAELRTQALDGHWAKILSFREDNHQPNAHIKRGNFEGLLHPAVTPLETLAAAYRLTGDARYARRAADVAVRLARELPVDNSLVDEGFYYTRTFYVRALAFVYDWTYDQLTPEERSDLKTTLLGFVLDIHGNSQSHGWGKRPLHRVWNWNPGLMGAAGIGMLALEGETRVAEKAILFECRRHLRDYLTLGIDRDGCGHEGPSYIGYGIGGGVEFVEILRRQGRGDLFVESNYQLCPPWLAAETLPGGGRWNNLSDCGHGQAPWPVYTYACGRLAELAATDPARADERLPAPAGDRPLDLLGQFAEAPGARQLSYGTLAGIMSWVWENGPGRNPPDQYDGPRCLGYLLFHRPFPAIADPARVLPLGQHFRGRGLVVARGGFGPRDWHFATEAGPHVAGHDQSDKGTFTYRAYGADLVIDSGYGNDGDVLKSGSSYAHNVVLIDGEGQPMRYHNQSSGKVTGFEHSPVLDWIRIDARDAWSIRYDGEWRPMPTTPVQRAERTFLVLRQADGVPPYLVVMDDIAKDGKERDYTWQWHIPSNMDFRTDATPWRAVPQTTPFATLTTAQEGGGDASFDFPVAKAGAYRLAGLTRAGGRDLGKSDSFFVSLDGGPRLTWDIPGAANLSWSWVQDRGADQPAAFDLQAGQAVVWLGKREPEAELAKLALVPADGDLPASPLEDPAGAVVRTVADARMGDVPFRIVPAGVATGPDVALDVHPVRPVGGTVSTAWYETSREGSHPRLHYTVRATEPRFLMVLVPRTADTPEPKVVPEGDWGARILWGDTEDTIQFGRGTDGHSGTVQFTRRQQGRTLHDRHFGQMP